MNGVANWMAEFWDHLSSVTVQESWIKLLRIRAEGDMAQDGERERQRIVIQQLAGCENSEKKRLYRERLIGRR